MSHINRPVIKLAIWADNPVLRSTLAAFKVREILRRDKEKGNNNGR